jgi:hypothetical protein
VVAVSRTYHVTAERGMKRWVLQCVEHPGALSEVGRLDLAAGQIREAIAFVAGEPEDSFEIVVIPQLPAEYAEHAECARQLRVSASAATSKAAEEARLAAQVLAGSGYTLRDIGTVMGVSFQRAAQLLG